MSKPEYEKKITLGRTLDNGLIRKSFYSDKSLADAKRKAEKYRINYEVDQRLGTQSSNDSTSFSKWALKSITVYKSQTVKGNTYENMYRRPVEKHLIPFFKETPLHIIKPIDIQMYFNRGAQKWSYETLKKDHALLRFIFQTAVDNGLCPSNPVTKTIQIPKLTKTPEKHAYSQIEYNMVFNYAKTHRYGLDIMMLLETGITRSELLGCRWDDLDLANGYIHIRQGLVELRDADSGKWKLVSDGLKNEFRERTIPIVSTDLLEKLKSKSKTIYIKDEHNGVEEIITDNIFYSPEGKPFRANNWFKRVYSVFIADLHAEYPEIPCLTPHELRHSAATKWLRDGLSPLMVAKLLGHSDLKMLTKIYDHTEPETLKNAIKKSKNNPEFEEK